MICKFTPIIRKDGRKIPQRSYYKSICISAPYMENQYYSMKAIYGYLYTLGFLHDKIRIYTDDKFKVIRCEEYRKNYWESIFNIRVLTKNSSLFYST